MRIRHKPPLEQHRKGLFGQWTMPSGLQVEVFLEMTGRKRKWAFMPPLETLGALDQAYCHAVLPKQIQAKYTMMKQLRKQDLARITKRKAVAQ